MQYVIVLDIDESELDGDDSIENACHRVNFALETTTRFSGIAPTVRPLSEVMAA